ncbi:MAG: DUF1365 domain-containing protein [Rhodobacterales bacterium]|jgi:DUF1365 family protein
MMLEYVKAKTYHVRKGEIKNSFSYGVDYVLLSDEQKNDVRGFSHNKINLFSIFDNDHGGIRGQGEGHNWARDTLRNNNISIPGLKVSLLAQPRMFFTKFTPISFWLCFDLDAKLKVVIVEVNNTFGDRHSYLCSNEDLAEITIESQMVGRKLLHVSPFQPMLGTYGFTFDITNKKIVIKIEYKHEYGGVTATLVGDRSPLTTKSIFAALLRRPFGSMRILSLIHFQAFRLWIKKASFNSRPTPPSKAVSR